MFSEQQKFEAAKHHRRFRTDKPFLQGIEWAENQIKTTSLSIWKVQTCSTSKFFRTEDLAKQYVDEIRAGFVGNTGYPIATIEIIIE